MICSICKKGETSVVDSRPTEDGTAIRRRRLCVCGARFTTFERVQYREIMVVKKNGRKSSFDRDKLAKSVFIAFMASGLFKVMRRTRPLVSVSTAVLSVMSSPYFGGRRTPPSTLIVSPFM